MRSFRTNIREGSAGFEFFSAVTLLLLAGASAIDPHPSASVVVLLLSLSFPGMWLSLVFLLGCVHLFALTRWAVMPWIAIRKACSAIGVAIYCGLMTDVLHARPNVGAAIWLGTIVVFLSVAILRRNYGVT
jgi:hypothetical protein